jgi:peptidyl-dipeptidase Dcp
MSDLSCWPARARIALAIVPLLVAAVSTRAAGDATAVTATPAALDPGNPCAAPSTLPYGLPPFDRIHDGDFMPAFTAGMAEQLREVRAIATDPQAPSFENTSLALERSGRLLEYHGLGGGAH